MARVNGEITVGKITFENNSYSIKYSKTQNSFYCQIDKETITGKSYDIVETAALTFLRKRKYQDINWKPVIRFHFGDTSIYEHHDAMFSKQVIANRFYYSFDKEKLTRITNWKTPESERYLKNESFPIDIPEELNSGVCIVYRKQFNYFIPYTEETWEKINKIIGRLNYIPEALIQYLTYMFEGKGREDNTMFGKVIEDLNYDKTSKLSD